MKKKLGRLIPWTICVLTFLVIIGLTKLNVFQSLEFKSYDARVNFSAKFSKPNDDIVLILVDQYSITQANKTFGWSWPWPREAYGKIYSFLDQGKASSCTYDILFTEPSILGQSDDDAFANLLSSGTHTKSYAAQFMSEGQLLNPIEKIKDSLSNLSNTTSATDEDGTIRRTRITDDFEGHTLVSMGFRPVYDLEDGVPSGLPSTYDNTKNTETLRLNFRGDINRYPHFCAFDILDCIDKTSRGEEYEDFSAEDFENAHVFVLYYAPGLFDICSSPVSKVYPGSGIPITTLDNLLSKDFIRDIPLWLNYLFVLLFCIAGVHLAHFSGKRKRTFSIVAANILSITLGIGLVNALTYIGFVKCLYMWSVPLLAAFVFSYLAKASIDYFMEGRQKRFIKGAFSQYLSPSVINQLISNPEKLKLGGEKRNISIFFSDVQSFTTLSEGLTPEKLTDLLNCYLSEMSSIILETGGTIDKYEGDAIIAFWNAPTDIPNHSNMALEVAVKCQQRLKEMEDFFISKVGRPMWTRIGINTGDAVVGNMGSQTRFDYTMFGDAVNLASRLEGLNKQFGTYIMCSESTMAQVSDNGTNLAFRQLGKVQVVGKTQAVTVYEPMLKEEYQKNFDSLEKFSQGLNLFYDGKIKEALSVFETNTSDAPSSKYAEHCREIIEDKTVIDEHWTGVWIAKGK
ncbi:CHASE2 domain-containing protein [Treponema sp.]|uniref:CHASE2 domain-containing protein n=1 Tax=Treponema sp. TaxID=166 RepID=UPI00388D5ECE